jgi:hypothetical protein
MVSLKSPLGAGVLLYCSLAATIQAGQVTLIWDANPEPNLGGYTVYYGQISRNYPSSVDVGNQTTYTLIGLQEGTTYYFAVKAYDITRMIHSDFSNEVSFNFPNTSWVGKAHLESPSLGSFESGIGLIRGWVCDTTLVEIQIDDGELWPAAYGTKRADTEAVCGDNNNGFGLTFNWNQVGDGPHTLRVFADRVEFAKVTFTVTTLGEQFLLGASSEYTLPDFPVAGKNVTVRWSEPHQNFVLSGFSGSQ